MTILNRVRTKLKNESKGVPFLIRTYFDLGSKSAIQRSFSKLIEIGEVKRLDRGIYACPKLLKFSSKPYYGSAEDLAYLWAKQFGLLLVAQGMEEAYQLGFQTQMPMRKVFWSNGRDRQFRIDNEVVEILNKRNLNTLIFSTIPAGKIYRALTVLSQKHIKQSQLVIAFQRLQLSEQERNQTIELLLQNNFDEHIKIMLKQLKISK